MTIENQPSNEIVVRSRDVALRSRSLDARDYFAKAIILFLLLVCFTHFATALPTIALIFVFALYAAPIVVVTMFKVLVRRWHRQYLFNECGDFSKHNRVWLFWVGVASFVSLFSGLFFVANAPSWDNLVWVCLFLSIPVFFLVYLIAQRFSKKEYAPEAYKSKAITISVVVTGLLLCAGYAFITMTATGSEAIGLRELIENRSLIFSDSSCALLAEADKINSFIACLTQYGLSYFSTSSYVVAFVIDIVINASIFFGFVGQLAFCVLTFQNIKSSFSFLPANNEDKAPQPLMRRYIAMMVAVWVLLSFVFIAVDGAAEKARVSGSDTVVDVALHDVTEWLILASENSVEDVTKFTDQGKEKSENLTYSKSAWDSVVAEQAPFLEEKINAYYDSCIGNVDSYLDWRDEFAGGFAKTIQFFGKGMADGAFEDRVIKPVDEGFNKEEFDAAYRSYIEQLNSIWVDYRNNAKSYLPDNAELNSDIEDAPDTLELWPALSDDEKENVLLNSGADRDAAKDKIVELINARRNAALDAVEYPSEEIFKE